MRISSWAENEQITDKKGVKKMFRWLIKLIAIIISAIATFIAHTSTTACVFWELKEPKMPEFLIKKD